MALVYFDKFKDVAGVGNFGDDINPRLMKNFISRSILESDRIALYGVGTILNDKNIRRSQNYSRKVVFSSGVGYGPLETKLDDSWDIACVRGPRSAEKLEVSSDKAIADGAILLSELYETERRRSNRPLFIPHVNSDLSSGRVLSDIADRLGMDYMPPSVDPSEFIYSVAKAPLIVTEAMHGAILADTMRVKWIPIGFHEHLSFKWNDWMESVELGGYDISMLLPKCWNQGDSTESLSFLRSIYRKGKEYFLFNAIKRLLKSERPLLSEINVLERKKAELLKTASQINERYG